MALREGVCPPEAPSKSMVSPLFRSPLNPVCADTLTYHLTALPFLRMAFSVYLNARMSGFDRVSAFYFGRWPCPCLHQLNRIHFTFSVLSTPLNFQPNWAYRSISCGFPHTCLFCVCLCVCVHVCVCVEYKKRNTQTHRGRHCFLN